MSATNTPNQGFPLVQLSDRQDQLPGTFAALASRADTKAATLDADVARAAAPNVVKISCQLGYKSANDPNGIGPQFDTIDYNRGTPTDLSVYNGLMLNRGLWLCGIEAIVTPVSSFGNNWPVEGTLATGTPDPSASGVWAARSDVLVTIQANGFPTTMVNGWGVGQQEYLNSLLVGIAPVDGVTVQWKGVSFADSPYMTMWAVRLGDF